MKLSEIRVGLEDIQQVEGQFEGLLVVVSQGTRDSPEESLVLEHILHVFVGETEVKEAHRTLDLVLYLFFIETLNISVQILHADFREINLRTLGFLNKYERRE
jgi:hypothetical protein